MQVTVIAMHFYRGTSTHQRKSVFENFISRPNNVKEHSRETRVTNLINSKYMIYPEKPMDSCIITDQFSEVSSLYVFYIECIYRPTMGFKN